MELRFYKLRLCDSDLILVDDMAGDGRDRDWASVARHILHRRRGAGADRLAVIAKAESDTWLRVFGRAGEGGPRADAALCAARYLLDSGRTGSERVSLRVSGGKIEVDVLDSASLGVDLGPPRRALEGGEPLGPDEAAALATLIEAAGARYQVLPLRVGLPGSAGLAVFAQGASAQARLRVRAGAGERAAAVGVRVLSRGEIVASAPTGSELDSAAAAALALAAAAATGRAEREAMVRLGAGALWIEWTARGTLYAVGRPEYSYRGEFYLPEN